jgi:OmpA-OmpF porin, OOP family
LYINTTLIMKKTFEEDFMGDFKFKGSKAFALCCLLLLFATAASAENRSGAVTVSPFVGKYFFDKHTDYNDDMLIGGGLGYNFTKIFAAELSYGRVDTTRLDDLGNKVDGALDLYRLEGLCHLLPNSSFVPFFALGVGLYSLDSVPGRTGRDNDFAADYGAGFKYFLNPDVALRADVRQILNFKGYDEEYDSNWFYTAGLCILFGGGKMAEPAPVVKEEPPAPAPVVKPEPKDSDNDGVNDDLDKCPDTPAGVKVDQDGCPVDSDGDGVPDYLDKCPNTPKDTKVDTLGCPVAEKAVITKEGTYNYGIIYFDTNKSNIKPKSRPVLNNVYEYLNRNKEVKLEIQGHADSTGPEAYNQKLSGARAMAVRNYLIKKGVAADRLTAKGYGESRPTADNSTVEGRAKNRRIEFMPIQ